MRKKNRLHAFLDGFSNRLLDCTGRSLQKAFEAAVALERFVDHLREEQKRIDEQEDYIGIDK